MSERLHFFVSRAGEDRELAKWIAAVLRDAGHSVTIQDDDFKPGHSFLHQMKLALDAADHLIALISPHYIEKDYTLNELYSAVAGDAVGKKRSLIPIRIADCELPHPIKHFV